MLLMPMVVRFARFLRCGLCGRLLQVWLVGEEPTDRENPEWYAAEAEERLPPAVGERMVLYEHEVIDRIGPMHTH